MRILDYGATSPEDSHLCSRQMSVLPDIFEEPLHLCIFSSLVGIKDTLLFLKENKSKKITAYSHRNISTEENNTLV
jgi:hypothetical protein